MKRTYTGGCHCGAVRFEADVDFSAGTFKCNCPMCTKTRMWGVIVQPDEFRLLSGQAELQDYQPYHVDHVFCKTCGVRSFATGSKADGGAFYAIRVYCLDGVDVDELMNAPVAYFDGLHDNFESAPAEIRHL